MGKINGCLKCFFVFFNSIFAGLGCLMIYGSLKASVYSSQLSAAGGPGAGWGWVFALGMLAISCLGIYGGKSEKALPLRIFAGLMVVGMIIMMIFGIIVAVTRNKVKDALDSGDSDMIKPYLEEKELKQAIESWQQVFSCCGVVDARDWGDRIPETCECRGSRYGGYGGFGGYGRSDSSECKPKPQGTSGPAMIYSKRCGDSLFEYVDFFCQISMGIFFGFGAAALLGLLLSVLMICQVQRSNSAGGASFPMKGY